MERSNRARRVQSFPPLIIYFPSHVTAHRATDRVGTEEGERMEDEEEAAAEEEEEEAEEAETLRRNSRE